MQIEQLQVGEMVRLDDTKANKVQEDWITLQQLPLTCQGCHSQRGYKI